MGRRRLGAKRYCHVSQSVIWASCVWFLGGSLNTVLAFGCAAWFHLFAASVIGVITELGKACLFCGVLLNSRLFNCNKRYSIIGSLRCLLSDVLVGMRFKKRRSPSLSYFWGMVLNNSSFSRSQPCPQPVITNGHRDHGNT